MFRQECLTKSSGSRVVVDLRELNSIVRVELNRQLPTQAGREMVWKLILTQTGELFRQETYND